ncbi:MAG TPA: sigma-70 family RNA polymerase sigma factor [Pseudonocardia sp.]|nr:sigma-70 family RNA polymerase sigma factor [Pseudonocardia sp.]
MTQRVDPRVGQPATRRPGGPVPLLPRQRPDEVPPPPMPENSRPGPDARNTGRPAFGGAAPAAMPPRVAEPRAERATPDPEAVTGSTAPEPAETAPPETTDSNGLAGWDLVRRTQAGDQEAFGQLYDRYHEMVFRYVLFRTSDRQLAEDLTAETFLRALRRIGSVSYQGRDIGAWFVTIARNLVLDHVKSSRYRLEQTTSEIQDLSPSTTGPEQQVLDGATHEELLRCVAKLNSDQKECIALRFLQGLSVAETARLMGRNEGAVKALQHRAVRRLAQLLPEGLR